MIRNSALTVFLIRKENAMTQIFETAMFMIAAGVLVFFLKHRRKRRAL
jgi:hypothetical protein